MKIVLNSYGFMLNPFVCFIENEVDMTQKVMVDKEPVTLADLAGIDMDSITERRGEALPKGVYAFEVEGGDNVPQLNVIGENEKAKGAAIIKFKVLEVVSVTDSEFTGGANTLIGKTHQEAFFLTTIEGLGYLKAFLKDIGAPYNKNLKTMLFNSAGTRFQAPIGKRKDRDDADKIYTNIVRNKMKPISSPQVA